MEEGDLFISCFVCTIIFMENNEQIDVVGIEFSDVKDDYQTHEFCLLYSQAHFQECMERNYEYLDKDSKSLVYYFEENDNHLPDDAPASRRLPIVIRNQPTIIPYPMDLANFAASYLRIEDDTEEPKNLDAVEEELQKVVSKQKPLLFHNLKAFVWSKVPNFVKEKVEFFFKKRKEKE